MKCLLAIIMLLATLPACAAAPPPAAPLCPDLRLLLRAMPDRAAVFAAGRPAPHSALFEQCRWHAVDFTDEVICTWRLPSAAPAVQDLAAEAARCLPAARRPDGPVPPGEAQLIYELQVITIGQSGNTARLVLAIMEG